MYKAQTIAPIATHNNKNEKRFIELFELIKVKQ